MTVSATHTLPHPDAAQMQTPPGSPPQTRKYNTATGTPLGGHIRSQTVGKRVMTWNRRGDLILISSYSDSWGKTTSVREISKDKAPMFLAANKKKPHGGVAIVAHD